MVRTVATLPEAARGAFKEPLGPIFQDAQRLLSSAGSPIITVGDVVTYHLVAAGVTPHVSIVDGLTERSPVSADVEGGVPDADREVTVENPAAELTDELLSEIGTAIDAEESTLIRVEGEEDLATLPVILRAPDGACVIYGQPGEGMVCVDVTHETRETVRKLCEHLDTDERFWTLVGAESPS